MDKDNKDHKAKEKYELHIQWLDNGIVLAEPAFDTIQCEKFSNNGKDDDMNMHEFFGQNLWADICSFCNNNLTNQIKITITIEEE